jgi:5S rRNA maturation endonuclease (ribonuclease M5)
MIYEKVRILTNNLGMPKKSSPSANGELMYKCPFCYSGNEKYKMGVNINKDAAHCWICEWKGSVIYLLKAINASSTHIETYAKFSGRRLNNIPKEKPDGEGVKLPKGYTPIFAMPEGQIKSWVTAHLNKERNLTDADIIRYGIGYCDGRIVIPSKDTNASVNYYVARSFIPSHMKPKYRHPSVPKSDIIFNDLFIDWDSKITLVEGVYDALVTTNAIPLLGKTLSNALLSKIIREKPEVVLLLDGDKEGRQASRQITKQFGQYGVVVRVAKLGGNKDPSEAGRDSVRIAQLNAKSPSFIGHIREMLHGK